VPSHSLFLFGLEPDHWVPVAKCAEAAGYDTLWLGDHLVWPASPVTPYPYDATGCSPYSVSTPLADVWMLVAHLAACTHEINLGPGVLIAPLRHPLSTARSAQTAQLLAPGRIVLGLGSGWLREEFALVDVPFEQRGRRLDETVQVLRKAWQPGSFAHEGEVWSFADADLGPRPEPAPPLLLGGFALPALRRAARYGDGWLGTAAALDVAVNVRERLEALRAEESVDRPFRYSVRLERLDLDLVRAFTSLGFDDLAIHLRDLVPKGAPLGTTLDAISNASRVFELGQRG
jgi:probable F420-dependent oxidoreductase